jgi:hypothetical protein
VFDLSVWTRSPLSTTHIMSNTTSTSTWLDSRDAGGIAGTCAVLAVLFSARNIYNHLRHYNQPKLQLYIVRIIIIVPIYAIESFISLLLPDDVSTLQQPCPKLVHQH